MTSIPRSKPPPLPHSATPSEELYDLHHSSSKLNGKPMKFLCASGPFTSDSNLEFDEFNRLMDGVEKEGADVVLLVSDFELKVLLQHEAWSRVSGDWLELIQTSFQPLNPTARTFPLISTSSSTLRCYLTIADQYFPKQDFITSRQLLSLFSSKHCHLNSFYFRCPISSFCLASTYAFKR